jgi:methylenetetrahydrofolate dehydrogenase (NADP+)/methenyltetrahydrofolate cyclohydrolase
MGLSNVYGVAGWGRSRPRQAALIDGEAIAAELRAEVGAKVAELVAAGGEAPGLATVLVGADPASRVYVGAKHRACAEVGIRSVDRRLPADGTERELLELIDELNADPAIDGILVQLPLPGRRDPAAVIDRIDPGKDVDGLATANVGSLWRFIPELTPCTPAGVVELLTRSGFPIEGSHAVIVGHSELVGRPLAALLLQADATVTICHRHTRGLAGICSSADLLVAALGKPREIGADHVKPGAYVIDVGINRTADGLVGDIDFEAVREVAGAITPVPGGVGPMTIACLLRNTLRAAVRRRSGPRISYRESNYQST